MNLTSSGPQNINNQNQTPQNRGAQALKPQTIQDAEGLGSVLLTPEKNDRPNLQFSVTEPASAEQFTKPQKQGPEQFTGMPAPAVKTAMPPPAQPRQTMAQPPLKPAQPQYTAPLQTNAQIPARQMQQPVAQLRPQMQNQPPLQQRTAVSNNNLARQPQTPANQKQADAKNPPENKNNNSNSNNGVPSRKTKIRKIILLSIEILVVLAVLGGLGFYYSETLLDALVHTRKITSVPDLKNKSVLSALDILNENNLALKKAGEEFDATVPAGMIIRQLPTNGATVREGKIVRVWISQGGEAVFSPKLIGMPLRNAELTIRQNQLLLGEISEKYSLLYPKGQIMSQDPAPDASLSKNALINLVVSSGDPKDGTILMPNFKNKKRTLADEWAAKNGIEIDYKEDAESTYANDTVLEQSFAPDTVLEKGAKVVITISYKDETGAGAKRHNIFFEIPAGKGTKKIRITLTDAAGEKEVFAGTREAGEIVRLSVPHSGQARVRYYLDGVLVGEGEVQ